MILCVYCRAKSESSSSSSDSSSSGSSDEEVDPTDVNMEDSTTFGNAFAMGLEVCAK